MTIFNHILFCFVLSEGAYHQWKKIPPRELSIDLAADEGSAGRLAGSESREKPPLAVERPAAGAVRSFLWTEYRKL
jgi:hypothetical protein